MQFLNKLHDDLTEHVKGFSFDKNHPWHRNLVCLYLSILELSKSIIILFESNVTVAIPSVLRTILETYVEFINLINDKTYGYYMEAAHEKKTWLKLLEEADKRDNIYLADLSKLPDLSQRVESTKKSVEDLQAKGYKPLLAKDRFKKAGLMDVYNSAYNTLSADVHSNIQALLDRHIEIENGNFNVILYKGMSSDESQMYINWVSNYLTECSVDIHELLKSKHIDNIKALQIEAYAWFEKLWEQDQEV